MFPGSNLLEDAMELIDTVTIEWIRFKGRTLSEIGIHVSEYHPPVFIEASVQAAGADVYERLGLSWQKKYFKLYASIPAEAVERGTSGDRFVFNGELYQMVNDTPWHSIDGWMSTLIVRIEVEDLAGE